MQVRVSVDIVASTHLITKDWSLAIALYKAVADEMRQSNDLRKALAIDMEARARAVTKTFICYCYFYILYLLVLVSM